MIEIPTEQGTNLQIQGYESSEFIVTMTQ